MEEEAELVSRMGEVLTGELDRRQTILRQAGIQVGAAGHSRVWPSTRSTVSAAPTLSRCQRFSSSSTSSPSCCRTTPTSSQLFDRICRVGRSLRVHLLLATQSLQHRRCPHRQTRAQPDLSNRVAHHQFSRVQGGDRNAGGAIHHQQGERRRLLAGRHGGSGEVQQHLHRHQLRARLTHRERRRYCGPGCTPSSARDIQIHQFTAAPILDAAVVS